MCVDLQHVCFRSSFSHIIYGGADEGGGVGDEVIFKTIFSALIELSVNYALYF